MSTVILGLLISALFFFALRKIIRDKKRGKTCCGCSCKDCGGKSC